MQRGAVFKSLTRVFGPCGIFSGALVTKFAKSVSRTNIIVIYYTVLYNQLYKRTIYIDVS